MITLTNRLAAIRSLIPNCARVLDVGTDHALLPISLLLSGGAERVWASDINKGPLEAAAENAARFGVSDRLTLYLSDGLTDCFCRENSYDVIVIAGMGGQTIAEILANSDYAAEAAPTLILQPMTMQYELRSFLCASGYEISEDRIVYDAGKYYTLIVCRYSGKPYSPDDARLTFGVFSEASAQSDGVFRDWLREQEDVFSKIAAGKKAGRRDCSYENSMLEFIHDILAR